MRYLYLFILSLLLTANVDAQVVINEFSAANMDGIVDNYNEQEDWVELYNLGSSNVDLSGYFLSDNLDNPDKWPIPAGVNIGPGEHLIIFCSDRDESIGNFIHAGFKLTQTKEEYVVLHDPSLNLVDAIQILQPNQANHSTGRVADGDPSWGIFQNPTPGGPNSNAAQGYEVKPTFSEEPGFYTGGINIALSAPVGTEIRFTLDGSEPNSSSTLYTNPISISQTTVVKAICFSPNTALLPSFVEANTYFIDEVHTMAVLSVAGSDLADLLDGTQFDPRGSFEFFESDGTFIDEAYGEYNKHGNDSWAYPQRGIDYITRDQMGYTSSIAHEIFPTKDRDRYQRLILKAAANDNYPFEEGAHIRDAYIHTLSDVGDFEMDERTSRPCIIYLNGEYWGLYEIREKVDDPDYTRNYYDQGEKWLDYLKTWGGTWEEYGSRADWDDLHNFITTNDMSDPVNYATAEAQLNMKSLIDYMIMNTHVVCMDWLNWNTAWWRGRKPDGEAKKWRYTLWDMDATFGHYINYTQIPNTDPTADPCYAEDLPTDFEGHGAMISALMENEDFHSLYVNRYADLNNSYFTCDFMFELLDNMIAELAPEMERHTQRWGGSVPEWESRVEELKDFISTRCTEIDGGIVDCYEVEGPYPVTVNVQPPNSGNQVRVNTYIPPDYPFIGDYFAGTNLSFAAVPAPDWELDHWEVDNNVFSPDEFSDTIQLSLANDLGENVTAFFRPAIPCAPGINFEIDTTLSSIVLDWEGPTNIIGYEFGYREAGSGGDFTTLTLIEPGYTIFGLDLCTEYEVRIRTVCDFAIGDYTEFLIKTKCFTNAEESQAGIFELNTYPNPFTDQFTVDLVLDNPTDVSVQILNLSGQTIMQNSYNQLGQGQHRIIVDSAPSWASGIYLIKIVTEDGILTRRLVKD